MIKFYQTFDLMVNGYAKRFLKRKFNQWYSGQVKVQLDDEISTDDVQVRFKVDLSYIYSRWMARGVL